VAPVVWNTRKIPFFSLLENSRSEDGGQGRAVLGRVHRSEAETLDGHRSGGYTREARLRCPFRLGSFFSTRLRRSNLGYCRRNRAQPIFLLAV
jgi:hypothetical protein